MITNIIGLGGILLLHAPTLVEFRLDSSPPGVQVPTVSAPSALSGGGPYIVLQPPVPQPKAERTPLHTPPPLATGFGRDVPLDFAVRQVIPLGKRVVFRDTVDRMVHVTWQGGKPWPQILATMLRPLGLRAALTGDVVRITN